jgi:flagellar basal-body rod modification protein FlgD
MAATSSAILGQYENNLLTQSTTSRVATDKDTFLKLLVAQLSHQDPLNPVEDKEFIAQLASFTQVEELQNINKGMEALNASYLAQQTTNAASLIGREVLAGGDNLVLTDAAGFTDESQYPGIYFTLPGQSSGGTFTVYAMNADGTIGSPVVRSSMPGYTAGMHPATWNGCNAAGEPMPNGSYAIVITADDMDGNPMLVTTSSNGVVIGVETSPDGNHKLYLGDGRTVNFADVELITVARYADNTSGDGSADDSADGSADGSGTGSADGSGTGSADGSGAGSADGSADGSGQAAG